MGHRLLGLIVLEFLCGCSDSTLKALDLEGIRSTSLEYRTNPARYVIGQAIAANEPVDSSAGARDFAISPALPAGLSMDSSTGVISGTPSEESAERTYEVSARSNDARFMAELVLSVVQPPPTNLTYAYNPAYYAVGEPIPPNQPQSLGGPIALYVTSGLPAGLLLDSASGVISGTPSGAASAASYTVTASNSGGSTSATLTLGADQRVSGLSYLYPTAVYPRTFVITPNVPMLTSGTGLAFSVSPPLPSGLALDPATGHITGTPVIATATASYTIKAENAISNDVTALSIEVVQECATTCVAPVPIGWTGPVARGDVGVSTTLPACAGDYLSTVGGTFLKNMSDTQHSCNPGCSCAPSCWYNVTAYDAVSCSGTVLPCGQFGHYQDTCTGSCNSEQSFRLNSKVASCSLSTSGTFPPLAWGAHARLCSGGTAQSGNCPDGWSCRSSAAPGFDLCVYQATSDPTALACPTGYPTRDVYYASYTDQRTCAGCNCSGSPDCSSTVVTSDTGATCNGSATTVALGTCYATQASRRFATSITGTCTPTGTAVPSGSVLLNNPTVVCCR